MMLSASLSLLFQQRGYGEKKARIASARYSGTRQLEASFIPYSYHDDRRCVRSDDSLLVLRGDSDERAARERDTPETAMPRKFAA